MGRRGRMVLLTLALTWLLCEGTAALGLALVGRASSARPIAVDALTPEQRAGVEALLRGELQYVTHSATLGWTIVPGGASRGYTADARGLRGGRDPAEEPAPGTTRIACFGDSFTHGDDVADAETWEAALERRAPRTEVLNFGVPAFGPDQALLRFRGDGARVRAQVVLFGVLSENIYRVVNVFRPFYEPRSPLALAKPRFAFPEGGGPGLALLENPLPTVESYRALLERPAETLARLGARDHFYATRPRQGAVPAPPTVRLWRTAVLAVRSDGVVSPHGGEGGAPVYDTAGEAYEVLARILETGADEARARGSAPAVLLFPKRGDVEAARRGEPAIYSPLAARLRARGERVCDLAPAFAAAAAKAGWDEDGAPLYQGGGHYTARGNEVVAEAVKGFLEKERLLGR